MGVKHGSNNKSRTCVEGFVGKFREEIQDTRGRNKMTKGSAQFYFWLNMYGNEIKGDEIGGTCSKRGDTVIGYRIRVLNQKRG
jgi:hypothetical protein